MKGLFGALLVIGLAGISLALCPNPCNKCNQYTRQPCQGDCNKYWNCNKNGEVFGKLLSCGENWYFDPALQQCSFNKNVCEVPEYSDPCKKSNEFTMQPCKEDCTKFWICDAYVPGAITSKLYDCNDYGGNGPAFCGYYYWDPVEQVCTIDRKVCFK